MKRTQLKSDPDNTKAWKARSVATAQSKPKKPRVIKPKKRGNVDAPSRAMLDTMWSEVVRLRALGECQLWKMTAHRCHEQVDAHHIIGRINYPTRWELDNGISLCKACHYALHNRDTGLMTKLCEEVKGPEVMERLRAKNRGLTKAPTKGERVEIYAALKSERDRLKMARDPFGVDA